MSTSWPAGAATGVGSLPGTDPVEAARLVAGELPDLPHLPELPARGPGADLLGRGAALLAGLHVDRQPSGWRLVARPGLDHRRAVDHLRRDLDAVGEVFAGRDGAFKCQAAGPWTLAAGIELPRGDRVLADRGAVRDVAAALAEGVREHVAELRRRLPGAEVVVQLDEPALPGVRAGRIPTASGFGALAAVGDDELAVGLRTVFDAATAPVGVHCCAADPPLALFRRVGARFVSFDLGLPVDPDAVGEAVEAGVVLFAGALPTVDEDRPTRSVRDDAAPIRALWRRLGFDAATLPEQVVVTPACGLAGASPDRARAVLKRAREVGRSLAEAPEERGGE